MKNKIFFKVTGVILFVIAGCAFRLVTYASSAKEITLLYTGDTHAMLYTCSCPVEKDGGIARRATLLKELRKKYPGALVLDSGSFFAGGAKDEYSQNTEADKKRAAINLKAMELMKYDAAAVSVDEFNFGSGYLKEAVDSSSLNFLSANFMAKKVKPYLIKDVSGVKVGIVGVTPPAAGKKAEGEQLLDYKESVAGAVTEARKDNAQIIVLLSQLPDQVNKQLSTDVTGIDVIISGYSGAEGESSEKPSGQTLILKPAWQGRKLGKAILNIKENKITASKIEDIRLSDKISDDPEIAAILPRCFQDSDCKKEGMIGLCQNPGANDSTCLFSEAHKVPVTVITSKDCFTCDTQIITKALTNQIPGFTPTYLYYPDKEAQKLIQDFNIKGLPAYLLGREVEKEKSFNNLKGNMELKGDYYLLKPQVSGMSFFLGRNKTKGSLDVFISLFDPEVKKLLDVLKDFNPKVHLLAISKDDGFDAPKGSIEVEEDLRGVCVQKYYPDKFWDYISCRASKIYSTWWEDCAAGMDEGKIKACARGQEGKELLNANITLNKELEIMLGPTYLMDNQEVFASKGAPSKEELKKILKR
ncbi:MAG: hypothetical protein NT060_04185 [Candidatus Omnitrophica bacterium]|nr:hypothetical protein [Candidatus Omnitrophota bacterium]